MVSALSALNLESVVKNLPPSVRILFYAKISADSMGMSLKKVFFIFLIFIFRSEERGGLCSSCHKKLHPDGKKAKARKDWKASVKSARVKLDALRRFKLGGMLFVVF